MNQNIVIGVDVGGSHIICSAIDAKTLQVIPQTTFSSKINNKASKNDVLKNWAIVINKTIKCLPNIEKISIGFAMPGPFQYKSGIAMFENNDKYENLYNVSLPNELPKFLEGNNFEFRFLNDATSFGVGVACMGKAKESEKVIAITLGTGFGSCFIKNGIPQVKGINVPEGGCLWDKSFKNGIADDFFSTRWFVKRYFELSGVQVDGVKEIVSLNNEFSTIVFSEFSNNLAKFLSPVINDYKPNVIVLGGNISNASDKFMPEVKKLLKKENLDTDFVVSNLMEEAAIIGSAKLFDTDFWEKIKNDLPLS